MDVLLEGVYNNQVPSNTLIYMPVFYLYTDRILYLVDAFAAMNLISFGNSVTIISVRTALSLLVFSEHR